MQFYLQLFRELVKIHENFGQPKISEGFSFQQIIYPSYEIEKIFGQPKTLQNDKIMIKNILIAFYCIIKIL